MRRLVVLAALLAALVIGIQAQDEEGFDLTLIHTNDTHAAHLPNSAGNGGVAILASVIKQIRAEGGNSLLVDAGDRFTGSLFHTTYVGADQVQIMNLLGYEAMVLGNHEFDNGDEALASFVDGVNFPVMAANVDFSPVEALSGIVPSTVLEVNGQQIGVIGLVTADSVITSSPNPALVFSDDYVGIVNAEAERLAAEGVEIVIVLTHIGYGITDQFIPALTGVDVVVDGHSHTLFSNTYSGAAGRYPLAIETEAGETVYYVQSGANSQYVGRLDLSFDATGVVTSAAGDSILLSRYITPDEEAAALIDELNVEVQALGERPTGSTAAAELDGRREVCRAEECVLGNLIADAMRFDTSAQIAIMNGGGIRASVDAGDITLGDLLTVQPFGNLLATFELTGANVILALENGVSGITVTDGVVSRDGLSGRFPQVSGIRFSFDPTQPVGSRIVSVEIDNGDGTFSPIEPDVVYTMVTNNFMRTGGDGYSILNEQAIDPYDFGTVDYDATINYFRTLETVEPSLEGRITVVNATLAPLE
ncbi:MAG: 5'-nucleotidase C-terminal domain-containing protein [Anaerolineae bacterium]|nr:5'-nucleotidase C-terminal domain-containing protein [Anaerolineae bacterium]